MFCGIIRGFTPRTNQQDNWQSKGIPFWTRKNMTNEKEKCRYINQSFFTKVENKMLEEGCVIHGISSLKVFWKPKNTLFNNHIFLLKAKDETIINERYLYFYLLANSTKIFNEYYTSDAIYPMKIDSIKDISRIEVFLTFH